MTPEQRAKRKAEQKESRLKKLFSQSIADIFSGSGFKPIQSEGKEFVISLDGSERTTEFDGLYIRENVILVVEETGGNPNGHLAKKLLVYRMMNANVPEAIEQICTNFPALLEAVKAGGFSPSECKLRILYFSRKSVPSEHASAARRENVYILENPLRNYFSSLVKSISYSAIYEILKFLNIDSASYGVSATIPESRESSNYYGLHLNDTVNYLPTGSKLLSFYIDPQALLQRSYVLRKDGWMQPEITYQRLLDNKKLKSMRKFLKDTKTMFLGNVVATLPRETKVLQPESGDQIELGNLKELRQVTVQLPKAFNTIGLIDGQHRVFAYHQSSDDYEDTIKDLRSRQTLLVTGIVFPEKMTDQEKLRFEAKLFKDINSKQSKVKTVLLQEIDLILEPASPTAIAKRVLARLSVSGPLKDLLEVTPFEEEKKLKVSSIVTYGLRPLFKRDGADSLLVAWSNKTNTNLQGFDPDSETIEKIVDFSSNEIDTLLSAIKKNYSGNWTIDNPNKILTPTTVNGYLKCLGFILRNGVPRSFDHYNDCLEDVDNFDFQKFKSSQWTAMGVKFYSQFFDDGPGTSST